jgi:L-amino acid N-acyltransferase YncA
VNSGNEPIIIRRAEAFDVPKLLEIYRPYVEHTAVSFEYETPSLEEFLGRVETILRKYPYLVAVSGKELIGYAYASEFKNRKAYDWSVETSIYVKQGQIGKGCGKALYQALEDILKRQHILNLNACIAYTEKEDQYADHNSMNFHKRMGYRLVGRFEKCGYKFGRWYDMIWMEKFLSPHPAQPEQIIPFGKLHC